MEKRGNSLTATQMEMVRRAFREIDSNGNGKISTSELKRASRVLGYNPTLKEVQAMVAEVDSDMNGQIDFAEFTEMMRERFGALEYQEMAVKEAFQLLDKDGNGYIDYDELRHALQGRGDEPLSDQEFDRVIADLDANRDGKIEYDELCRKMCSLEDSSISNN